MQYNTRIQSAVSTSSTIDFLSLFVFLWSYSTFVSSVCLVGLLCNAPANNPARELRPDISFLRLPGFCLLVLHPFVLAIQHRHGPFLAFHVSSRPPALFIFPQITLAFHYTLKAFCHII